MSNKKVNNDEKRNIDWHSGFEGGLKLSFRYYQEYLEIEREHPLSMKPLLIDFLVIKKNAEVFVDNAIGCGFRKHNIIEYKSPDDELNIDVLWKVIGYVGIYKSLGECVNAIDSKEITASIVRTRRPIKLFRQLEDEGYIVEREKAGIYRIIGLVAIPIRIIVIGEIDDDRLRALKILDHNASVADVREFLKEAKELENEADKRCADAVLQVSSKANNELYKRLRGDEEMCEALREIMADDLKEVETKTRNSINSLYVWLIDLDRVEDVKKAATDPTFMDELFEEYNACHEEKLL